VIVAVVAGGVAFAHYRGYGGHMMGQGYGGYGGHMMGPGYGGYGGHMMGPGSGKPCWGDAAGAYEGKTLTEKDANSIVLNYIGRNPNLKVGKIEDKETKFEAEVLTKDDSLVTRLSIDKTTGWVRPLY
jgi:hypothetical protein